MRHIHAFYLQHRSAYTVMRLINEQGHLNKHWVTKKGRELGGRPFTKTVVYRLLNDPLYIGKIQHKGNLYEGEHVPIISQEVWDQTQALLAKQTVHKSKLRTESGTILRGKCFDGDGRAFTTTYSVKDGNSHHRYYINKHNNQRIRGDKLEKVVFDAIHYACLQPEHLRECFAGEYALLSEEEGMYRLQNLWVGWSEMTEKDKHHISQQMIDKVTIMKSSTAIRIRHDALNTMLKVMKPSLSVAAKTPDIAHPPTIAVYDGALEITVPVTFKKKGKTSQALNARGKAFEVFQATKHDMALVNALGKSHKWEQMIRHQGYTPDKIAKETELSKGYVCSILRLNLLSPNIMEDILFGRQPEHLTLTQLKRPFPHEWEAQKLHFSY